MNINTILTTLKRLGRQKHLDSNDRFGIRGGKQFGVPTPEVRRLAKQIGTDHALALALWKTDWLEARYLATMIADPNKVTKTLMEEWAMDFDSWGIVDSAVNNLFVSKRALSIYRSSAKGASEIMPEALIARWAKRKEEYVKRAAFAMIATLCWHDHARPDKEFAKFLPLIEREACDERHYVKRAVNWAEPHCNNLFSALFVSLRLQTP